MIYVLDTSSLRSLQHFYPSVFKTIWEGLDSLVQQQNLVSTREVWNEIELQNVSADVLAWSKQNKKIFTTPNAAELDIFAPHPWKSYDLLPPALTQTITATPDGWQIVITAEKLALFVAVEADQPGRFCDNAVTIFPGYPATIIFTPAATGVAPQFTLRDLHSATYGH